MFTNYRAYPTTRMRRLRKDVWMRDLVKETRLDTKDFIWPLFVVDSNQSEPVTTMPGVMRHSPDSLLKQAEQAVSLGIPAIALFPSINASLKNEQGSEAINPQNLVCRSVKNIKQHFPQLGVIGDVALDPYTNHGHDGVIVDGYVHNDQTIELLKQQSLVQVEAGCDVIAPSDMMDGRIGAIRSFFEAKNQPNVHIMSYAAKYNSAFYGPFRDAVGTAGNNSFGGKESYQMQPENSKEALAEVMLDISEGADSIIIKPGMPYLDIIKMISNTVSVPVFAYQVSGEYAMLKAASQAGMLDWQSVMMESLLALKRAGATGIWSYFAPEAAAILSQQ